MLIDKDNREWYEYVDRDEHGVSNAVGQFWMAVTNALECNHTEYSDYELVTEEE